MRNQKPVIVYALTGLFLLISQIANASFIESTVGAAVVNDATATFYNPAALMLLNNPQMIGLGTYGNVRSRFTGDFIQRGFIQSGTSTSQTRYFLPSLYFGIPVKNKITLGLAVISNSFNRDIGDNSILRYVQASNSVNNMDIVPAIGVKLNKYISIGGNLNFSHASFLTKPVSGIPALNIPDSETRNESNANGRGMDVGILFKPSKKTLFGINYRSVVKYNFSGKSILEGNPEIISNDYSFTFWTPARIVVSINQFITEKAGIIATAQRIEWSVFQNVKLNRFVTRVGSQPVILNAEVPYHLRNTWLLTLGGHYRVTPPWVIRVAGSYNQSPDNPHYQISNGNSSVLGASTAYNINKYFSIDGSYAHVFQRDRNIHVGIRQSMVNGVNTGMANVVSLKLTLNLDKG